MTVVTDVSNHALQLKRWRPINRQREQDFYDYAWIELEPFFRDIAAQLVAQYGFKEDMQLISLGDIDDDLHIKLATSVESDGRHVNHLVHLPARLAHSENAHPSAPIDFATIVSPHMLHVSLLTLTIPPLVDLVCTLKCLFCADMIGPDIDGVAFPDMAWLKKHEAMIRDTMGDSHFRHLLEAVS